MSRFDSDFVPAPAPGVENCELDGERLVWQNATLHRLDRLGSLVWECFDGRSTLADIARFLADAFGTSEENVRNDVSALCVKLLDEGMLDGGTPPAPHLNPPLQLGTPPTVKLDPNVDLPFRSGRFQALHYDFGIRTNDARLATYFDRSLRSFGTTGNPSRWYSVVTEPDATSERYRIYLDDEGLFVAPDPDDVVSYVPWHVNITLITTTSTHVLVHSAGATLGQRAVVLPAEMNAGKTTLVAGLVLDGFGFLTDEMVAVNLTTGLIDPYPRPLNIGRGSWATLAGLRPAGWDERDPLPRLLWHVDASSIRPDAVAGPTPAGWVVTPRYEQGASTTLRPLSRPEAVELLHRNAFNGAMVGSAGIRALIGLVSQARCARLVNGDLASAVAAVRRFVEQPEPL